MKTFVQFGHSHKEKKYIDHLKTEREREEEVGR
jgi:hypothetical protein